MAGLEDDALLSCDQMGACDRRTIAAGTPGFTLMRRAGEGIAAAIRRRYRPCRVLVACGPGNNGGDGYVAAADLRAHGWPVEAVALGPTERLSGDAAEALRLWNRPVGRLDPAALDGAELLVDALFGAGLARDLDGEAAAFVADARERVDGARLRAVAVDMPSGVEGDTGLVRGIACPADLTVTFHRRKPGHLLRPGRDLCGAVRVVDIGILPDALDGMPRARTIGPRSWRGRYAAPGPDDHKYTRGHVVVVAGVMTGAARLAAAAARATGAGLVTVLAPPGPRSEIAGGAPGTIVADRPEPDALARFLERRKAAALVVGPGLGLGEAERRLVEAALASGVPTVLDADGISAFVGDAQGLAGALAGPAVLTPHAGEFARLFPDIDPAILGRLNAATEAAGRLGVPILLKGSDTVVASAVAPGLVMPQAPAVLASGGTGDVLAGVLGALIGQARRAPHPEVDAAAAAWLHAEAGRRASGGGRMPVRAEELIAELPELVGRWLWSRTP